MRPIQDVACMSNLFLFIAEIIVRDMGVPWFYLTISPRKEMFFLFFFFSLMNKAAFCIVILKVKKKKCLLDQQFAEGRLHFIHIIPCS